MPMTQLEASTMLLLHFDEASGNFVDSGAAKRILVKNGSPSVSSASKFGSYCYQGPAAQSGTDGFILSPGSGANSATFPGPGAGPYTIDVWVYLLGTPSGSVQKLFGIGATSAPTLQLLITTAGKFQLMTGTGGGGSAVTLTGTTTLALNTWYHLAACFDGTTSYIFVNGVVEGTSTTLPNNPARYVNTSSIGFDIASSGLSFTGRMDELRYIIGYPLLTSNFTPPSAPYSNPPAIDGALNRAGTLARKSPLFSSITPKLTQTSIDVRDLYYGGRGYIVGTVKEKALPANVPLRRRVRLIRERDGACARETWSDPVTGNYAFTGIDETLKYTVVSYDYLNNYRAVIADNLTPNV